MNKLIQELEQRIKLLDINIKEKRKISDLKEGFINYENKDIIKALRIEYGDLKQIVILKEYLAFAQKVEKEIDKTQFEGWYKEKVDLKERIFNG